MTASEAMAVALVEDDDDLRAALTQLLIMAGYHVDAFPGARGALATINMDYAGIVVTDVRMPQIGGIEMFNQLRRRDPELPILLMTGHGDVSMAVDALKAGAWDFLTKPFDPETLLAAVGRAVAQRSLILDNRRLRALAEAAGASPLVGRTRGIVQIREMIGSLAAAEIDVLIEGETGTGKELVARLIHRGGRRARHPFVPVACAAIPDAMLDDDLFASTGSIVSARGGTLLLDDVDRASPALQARLTRLAEERTIRPSDSHGAEPIDLRLIATADEQSADRIQPPLFYRLSAARLRLPPLRERLEDVPLLFAHLLDLSASRMRRPIPDLTPQVQQRLTVHDWPGNVRELAHFADRVVIGVEPTILSTEDNLADTLPERVDAFERQALIDAIVKARGEIGVAIQQLGLPRKTFYYKVQRLGIDIAALRRELSASRKR